MKELVNKYKLKKYTPWLISFLLLLLIIMPQLVYASDFLWIKSFISAFFNLLSAGIGSILIFLFEILVSLAKYNDFITSPAVTTGWVIVRDICNMFFILILLVIAFATILRLDGYNWKKDLPRLLIYAILINFSRTICGIMIDFSQVVMLTFVNAFAQNGANNLAYIFQVDKFSSLKEVNTNEAGKDFYTVVLVGSIASFFAILITAIMTVAIISTLLMRMVYIWIYVILSPAAFLLNSYAGGKSYYGQWMSKFTKELIGGPVLAFFLWLSLTVAGNAGSGNIIDDNAAWSIDGGVQLFTNGPFQKYIIVIGLLYGGMQVAQTIGGAAGKAAGNAMKRSDAVFDRTKKIAKSPLAGAVAGADFLNRKQAAYTGFDLNMVRQAGRIKAGFERSKKRDLLSAQISAAGNLRKGGVKGAITGFTATDWVDNYVKGWFNKGGFGKLKNSGEKNIQPHFEKFEKLKGDEGLVKTESEWMKSYASAKENLRVAKEKNDGSDSNRKNVVKYEEELKALNDAKARTGDNKVVFATEDDARAKRKQLSAEAAKESEYISKYKINTTYGDQESMAAISEAKKNVTSDNEDELVADFGAALSDNNLALAAAIAQRLVPVGGFDTLLKTYGYHAKGGFTEAEKIKLLDKSLPADEQKANEALYEKNKGANDFMRDIFMGRLGMSSQDTLRLQSNLAGAAESNSHAYLIKTVGANLTGLEQTSSPEREKVIVGEYRKVENEGLARKMNRYFYGSDDSGQFEFSPSGLMKFVTGLPIIATEIQKKRFNPNATKAFVEPETLALIKKVVADGLREGFIDGSDKNIGKEGEILFTNLENYAASLTGEAMRKLNDMANQHID